MQTARLWFARIVMVYALLIFAFLSYLYILEPLEHIAGLASVHPVCRSPSISCARDPAPCFWA